MSRKKGTYNYGDVDVYPPYRCKCGRTHDRSRRCRMASGRLVFRPANRCIECNREYWAIRRKTHPLSEKELVKRRVRQIAQAAVKSGKLIRQPCECCGKKLVEAHHDDYAKPLEVRWLCKIHHRAFHFVGDLLA